MPPFAWVLNLDAELELARPSYATPIKVANQLAQYGAAARALLGPTDVVVERGRTPASSFVGRAWCPTPNALAALRDAGVEPEPHPPVDVLRRVNHRRFAFESAPGFDEQRYFTARAPLEALFSRGERAWLLKRPLAFAGRGQMRVYDTVDDVQWSWIDASLRVDGLIVEPLVDPVCEFSLHGFVWRDGRRELGRICLQEVTDRGVFRAVRIAEAGELEGTETEALFERGERTAAALAAAGYFGPFGIDAYRYRDGERIAFCALGEINARYTMGFVTGFPRHPSELVLE